MKRVVVVILAVFALSCASMSPRTKLVRSHQSIQILLASVDDAERVLCFGSTVLPARPNQCSTATAKTVGLTDAKHRNIQRLLGQAYDAQIALADVIVIDAWVPGQPLNLDTLSAVAKELSTEVNSLTGSQLPDLGALIQRVRAWVTEVGVIRASFQKVGA
jgi:hypothetical protein